jgi:hypothetical protein
MDGEYWDRSPGKIVVGVVRLLCTGRRTQFQRVALNVHRVSLRTVRNVSCSERSGYVRWLGSCPLFRTVLQHAFSLV